MQAEVNAMLLAGSAHRPGACVVETGERVFRGIELDVDAAHIMARRPFDRILELEATADIDADAVAQMHRRCQAMAVSKRRLASRKSPYLRCRAVCWAQASRSRSRPCAEFLAASSSRQRAIS